MATFGVIQDRINNDYLNRSDLTAETARQVKAAIRHYERKRFWFNESSTVVTTTTSISFVLKPPQFFLVDFLRFQYASSATYSLNRIDPFTLREMRGGSQVFGQPTHFAIYGENIELFPIPDSAYSITVFGCQTFPELSASTDTTPWTSAAEDLITFHAAKLMWSTVLRNTDEAQTYAQLEKSALDDLRMANDNQILYAIRATDF